MAMEEIARKAGFISNPTPSPLSMHKDSQMIAKVKPKIRIIHIFAPEVIKTDVENFRELVQRLTGKPSAAEKGCRKKLGTGKKKKIAELRSLEARERIKEEQQLWEGGGNSSGGFLNGFGELDGFMQGFGEFPLLPLEPSATHMHGFGV